MLRKYLVLADRSSARMVMTQFLLSLVSYSTAASPSTWFTTYPPQKYSPFPSRLCPFKDNLALQRKADQASTEPYLLFPFVLGT